MAACSSPTAASRPTLIFDDGLELPDFAAFPLLEDEAGPRGAARYFEPLRRDRARARASASCWRPRPGAPTPTGRRGSATTARQLDAVNRAAIDAAGELRDAHRDRRHADRHQRLHRPARRRLQPGDADDRRRGAATTTPCRSRPSPTTEADMVTAITMTYADEAIGVAARRAARRHAGGDLVHGRDRRAPAERPAARRGDRAGRRRDRRRTRLLHGQLRAPDALRGRARGGERRGASGIRGLRANASTQEPRRARRGRRSSTTATRRARPAATPRCARRCRSSRVLGGCCGTDHRHVAAISRAWPA